MIPSAGPWVIIRPGDLFDVASMQFALHYMGQTEGRMRRFLHEVSRHLRVGGIFIATTMDSRVLIQLLMGSSEQSWVSWASTPLFSRRTPHVLWVWNRVWKVGNEPHFPVSNMQRTWQKFEKMFHGTMVTGLT